VPSLSGTAAATGDGNLTAHDHAATDSCHTHPSSDGAFMAGTLRTPSNRPTGSEGWVEVQGPRSVRRQRHGKHHGCRKEHLSRPCCLNPQFECAADFTRAVLGAGGLGYPGEVNGAKIPPHLNCTGAHLLLFGGALRGWNGRISLGDAVNPIGKPRCAGRVWNGPGDVCRGASSGRQVGGGLAGPGAQRRPVRGAGQL
jgi:hypothetical protein